MDTLVTDELWNTLAPRWPPHTPAQRGGRPRLPDRLGLHGVLFVLRQGIRWQSLPTQLGWGSGSTCWRRFTEWTQAGVGEKAHAHLVVARGERGLLNLDRAVVDSCSVPALRGGEPSGANPTDWAKKGCKRHGITAGHGIPLVVQIGPANRRDEPWLPSLWGWLWMVLRCGWRQRPAAWQGDRGYGFAGSIALVLAWGLPAMLAERGSPHGSGLGRTRYVVERTPSGFRSFRGLVVCYERSGAHFQGRYQLAACVICARRLHDGRQRGEGWQPFDQAA